MRVILVGGFLGAGKTTLLWEAAQRLLARSHQVGLITNDQVPDLVDTALLSRSGAEVREVAGSCFCCNFNGFAEAVHSLQAAGAEYILAEPVGSCTDLSATILQPAKMHLPECELAPLSVLVDPQRVATVLQEKRPRLHADAAYILHLQLEEADQILLNKADMLSQAERDSMLTFLAQEFPAAPVIPVSAKTGEGLDPWLDSVLTDRLAGGKIATVDYDRYANGEAVLGWLNSVVALRWIGGLHADWEAYMRQLFLALQHQLGHSGSEVGHVKMLLECADGRLRANLTALNDEVSLQREGALARLDAVLTVNARVQVSPERIEHVFREALRDASHARVAPDIRAFHCIRPGRPVPTYRFDSVVA